MKKSTIIPIIKPINNPIAINTAKITAQIIPKTRNNPENKIPGKNTLLMSSKFPQTSKTCSLLEFEFKKYLNFNPQLFLWLLVLSLK